MSQHPQAQRALFWATLAFAANFSVWTLYAVLGIAIRNELSLSATGFGLLVASPILTGALLRLPAGLLCERFSPKRLYIWQMLLVIPPLLLLPQAESYQDFLLCGLLTGISGVSFTLGVSYVSAFFPRHQQGTALGVFGAGNAGAAITLVLVPLVQHTLGDGWVGLIYAAGMLGITIAFALGAPAQARLISSQEQKTLQSMLSPLKEIQVWRLGLYYYLVFGSFLALILWLPRYYVDAYQLTQPQAMALTLLFTASSSMMRAAGGWFSDRYGAGSVSWSVFWICLVCLFFLSYPPTRMVIDGVDRQVEIYLEINVWLFTALMLIIGLAQGIGRASVYKAVHDEYPEGMGSVGGMVAMLGALGGCTLPVVFGLAVDWVGVHSASFMLLYGVQAVCMIVMYLATQASLQERLLKEARENNFLKQ